MSCKYRLIKNSGVQVLPVDKINKMITQTMGWLQIVNSIIERKLSENKFLLQTLNMHDTFEESVSKSQYFKI